MFLAWAADKAGLTEYVGEFAWTPSHAAWFIKQDAWTRHPEPGALVFFDWRGGKNYKGIDHVGVVERVEGNKIHTIEANVDRVWLKRKVRETDKVVGYGLPRLVKANAEKLDEIRATERPFVPAPRAEAPQGSPLDVLGTPPALLAAMVLMTVLLSLRVSNRRRGTHRRLPWPWNAPTAGTGKGGAPSPQVGPPQERLPVPAARRPAPAPASAPAPAPASARPSVPTSVPTSGPASASAPRIRVPAGSGRAATRHSTPTRRKPYEPD